MARRRLGSPWLGRARPGRLGRAVVAPVRIRHLRLMPPQDRLAGIAGKAIGVCE
jgi:hypothetical protein